jgi:hypothetical protein
VEAKMSLQARRELLFRIKGRYQAANKKEKTEILNGFIQATGYGRKHAIRVLAASSNSAEPEEAAKRIRRNKYDLDVQQALSAVWSAANQICSKRLVPFMPEFVDALERFGHLSISAATKRKLLSMSPATVDRILRVERRGKNKGRSTTKSGSLLKSKIKVRTYADWNDASPGFFEADLVAHCGDAVEGGFLNTLVLTDIATGWTEFLPLLNKGETDVISALTHLRGCLPVPLLGLDTDNGSEFINHGLLDFCESEKITFTRSRSYKKNDQAHVEQKNGNIIRRMVGFDRFDGNDAAAAMLELYQVLRLYVNFFQPSVKLSAKSRNGSRTKKVYDRAQTPYQRLISSNHISKSKKEILKQQFSTLDPVMLYREIGIRQNKLWRYAWRQEVRNVGTDVKPVPKPVLCKPEPSTSDIDRYLELLKGYLPKRQNRTSNKPRVSHTWRTRPDPFEEMGGDIELLMRLDPGQTAKQLFNELCERYPGKLDGSQYRTLQRRLSKWRKALTPHPLQMSLYADPQIQSHLDELIAAAVDKHLKLSSYGTNINDATPMS